MCDSLEHVASAPCKSLYQRKNPAFAGLCTILGMYRLKAQTDSNLPANRPLLAGDGGNRGGTERWLRPLPSGEYGLGEPRAARR